MAFAAPSVDIESVLLSVERKLTTLELFAKNKCNDGKELPPLTGPRNFRSDKAMHNAVESALVRLERIANTLPKTAHTGRSHIQAQVIDYDPGELFGKQVLPFVQELVKSASQIAKLTSDFGPAAPVIGEQASMLAVSVNAEAALVSRAAKMAKPADPVVFKAECEPLVDASADVSDFKYNVDVRSPLHDHTMALADTAATLGWVVSPTPLKHVRDYKQIVGGLTEKILSKYIELGCDPVHSDFAEALNHLMDAVVKYVEKEHPAGLRWNYAQGATPLGYKRAQRTVDKDAHPIGDFFGLMHGALTVYVLRSRDIGGIVAKHADGVLSVYAEMQKSIEAASRAKRPVAAEGGGELRMLLMSVQHELVPLVDALRAVEKTHPFYDHCVAVQEFIGSMQWCTATLNKMSPVTYIIDIESVTNKCLDRVDERFGKGKTYKSQLHHQWVESIRSMLAELKEYVITHHPNEMMFDTQRSRRSFDEIWKRKTLTSQIETLKKNSKSKKWVLGRTTKKVKGKRKEVQVWRRA